jgi:hypothetical protein
VQRPLVQRPLVQRPLVQRPLVQRPLVQRPLVQRPLVQRPQNTELDDEILGGLDARLLALNPQAPTRARPMG